jgi:dinuclear metal center YbgI/SA1388 family protein
MRIRDIANCLEAVAPINLQESYDNSGLLLGSASKEISKALITLDVTEAIVDEAINENCGLIIAHHPLIFKGLKKLTGKTLTERLVVKLIQSDIAVYAIHTNLDNVKEGVNGMLAKKLGLTNTRILSAVSGNVNKLITFCPPDHAEKVRLAMFDAGAGHIGNYDYCSYNLEGKGTFRGLEGSNAFVGKKGDLHTEVEMRIETVVPNYKLSSVVKALIAAHPYEEVAYDIYPLNNVNSQIGAGMIGVAEAGQTGKQFLEKVKKTHQSKTLKFSPVVEKNIKKVAICGGSGAFLIPVAYQAGADIFITGDVKYHDFFEYHGEMTIVDAGHYETEQFTKELIHSILKKKFPTFALLISNINTNPVNVL